VKILLLNPPFKTRFCRSARWQARGRGGTFYYPIWLSYAGAQLCRKHDIELVDCVVEGMSYDEVFNIIENYDSVIVDTSHASFYYDRLFIQQLKNDFPEIEVIPFGIPYRTSDLDISKRFNLCNDPNELTFVSEIYKEFLNVEDYFLSDSFYPMVQILGHGHSCWYNCTFCSRHLRVYGRDPKTCHDEMDWIKENLPQVKEIHFEDDTFSLSKVWTQNLCDILANDKFVWSCQERADVPFWLLKKMARSGCRLIIAGFESGNEGILKEIKKGINVDQVVKFSTNVRRASILLQSDFIFGLPGETEETIDNTRRLIRKIRPDLLQISIATPYPNTEFYDYVVSNGFLLEEEYLDRDGYQNCVISYPGLTAKEIQDAVDETLKSYYLSYGFVKRALRQILRKNGTEEFKRIYRSGRSFWRKFK